MQVLLTAFYVWQRAKGIITSQQLTYELWEKFMIDGTYEVKAKTPLGKKAGTLVLVTSGDTCEADLTIKKKTKHLEGTINGEEVTFVGKVKLPFPIGKVNYELVGTVEGDDLVGVCKTKKFSFDIHGTRAE